MAAALIALVALMAVGLVVVLTVGYAAGAVNRALAAAEELSEEV